MVLKSIKVLKTALKRLIKKWLITIDVIWTSTFRTYCIFDYTLKLAFVSFLDNELLSLDNKKGANRGAAFQFVNQKLSECFVPPHTLFCFVVINIKMHLFVSIVSRKVVH